jgi:DNA processing protein
MITHDVLLDWMSLRLAPEMSRARFYSLLHQFGSPQAVYGATAREIACIRGFSLEFATAVLKTQGSDVARRHLERMDRAGIRAITRDDADYPFGLTNSTLAPPLLFVKGELAPEDKYSVALVGSRHATVYGRSVARELAGGLARYGLTVVSGFARGIDGEAHHAAIKAGGRTIAVLGNGLDVCYPSEHRALGNEIAAHGALISEYPLGTPPDRYNFPERNHVIAALALGTVIVEAAEKSGSLITARLALEENRFIFAVPGDITRNNSRGANRLIQNGARMIQRAQDVLVEMKDVLRGYLDVDKVELEQAQRESGQQGSEEGDRRKKKDWVDGISGLPPEELELITRELQLDDRATENRLAMRAEPKPVQQATQVPQAGQTAQAPQTPQPPADAHNNGLPGATGEPRQSNRIPIKNLAEAMTISDFLPTASSARASAPSASAQLSSDERFIVDLLHHEAMVFDELADRAFGRGIDVPRLTSLLMKLEMKRVIRQLPGRYYVVFA